MRGSLTMAALAALLVAWPTTGHAAEPAPAPPPDAAPLPPPDAAPLPPPDAAPPPPADAAPAPATPPPAPAAPAPAAPAATPAPTPAAPIDPALAARQQRAKDLRARGQLLAQRGLMDLALDTYQAALEAYPPYPLVYNEMAVLLVRKGDLERAAFNLTKAIELDPDFADAYANLAEIQRRQSLHDLALSNYKQVLRLRPDDRDAFYGLAVTMAATKRRGEALWALRRYLERAEDPKARTAVEVAKLADGLSAAGVTEVDPLGLAGLVKGDGPAPEPGDEPAPEIIAAEPEAGQPGALPPHSGDRMFALHRYVAARDAYLQDVAQAPKDVALLYKIGATYAVMGDYRVALRWWRQALALAPDRELLVRHVGLASKRMSAKGQLALSAPGGGDPVVGARAALGADRPAAAVATLSGIEGAEARYLLGEASLRAGLLSIARDHFASLVQSNAKDQAAVGGLAEALVRLGQPEASAAMERWLGDRMALPEDFVVLRHAEAATRIQVGPPAAGSGDDDEEDW